MNSAENSIASAITNNIFCSLFKFKVACLFFVLFFLPFFLKKMKLWGSLSHSFFFFQIFLKFFRVHVSIRIQEWVVLYHRLLCCFLLLDFPSFVVPSNGHGGQDLKPHRMFTPSTIPKTKRILVDSLVHQTPPRMKCCNASNRMEWNELFATLSQPSPTPPQAGQLIPI